VGALLTAGRRAELRRMVRFGCVGLVGVLVNSALLWLLTERAQLYYVASSALATEGAILTNFALHHHWTFAALGEGEPVLAKLAKYNAVALGGLLLTVGTLVALTSLLRLHYLVANLLAVGVGTAWNYGASRRWAWRTPAPSGGRPRDARRLRLRAARTAG
jgi:dolichol-phosphate mannosyltransferase